MSSNIYEPGPRVSYVKPDYYSDEDSTSANEDYEENPQAEVQLWDAFRYFPPKSESGSMARMRIFEILQKVIKVLAYGFVFLLVLAGGVISKGTILFMTSHVNEDRIIVHCSTQIDDYRQFIAQLSLEDRVEWIWCIMIAFAVPEVFTLLRCIRRCLFKKVKRPKPYQYLVVMVVDTCYTIGLALLFFVVLPSLDVVKGAMITNCVCFVPGVLALLSRNNHRDNTKTFLLVLIDIAALVLQVTGFFLWPSLHDFTFSSWLLPPALILISCRWWSNYVSEHSRFGFVRWMTNIKEDMRPSEDVLHGFASIWKIAVLLVCAVVIAPSKGTTNLFATLPAAFGKHNVTITEVTSSINSDAIPTISELIPAGETIILAANYATPLYVLLIHVVSTMLTYQSGKFACKTLMQGFSFAFPVNLTIPVSISLLIAFCAMRATNTCAFHGFIPDYLFFRSVDLYSLEDFLSQRYTWIWLLWFLSQTWITLHIWTPKCERLASTDRLFAIPMYDSLLVDQSLALNRRKDDGPENDNDDDNEDEEGLVGPSKKIDAACEIIGKQPENFTKSVVRSSDHLTRIYACATMWHETKKEMTEFVNSILRMDEDQCARRVTQKYLKVSIRDYYELETHIFFDDAFCCMHGCEGACRHDENETQVNSYVMMLVETVDEKIDMLQMRTSPPIKYPTPYGGRLVWTLPGKTKMIAHLKDKNKIRHRKRWSQVMYMYYLLGYRLMDLPIDVDRKEAIAENTYVLTLDGDIDFQPAAVKVLVDLMKRNKNLGAACGRIHPLGSGPMVWFQRFEYAIGHWLQKSTEHLIGCVLCSPGCFSLFRAKALMEDNVMRRYATKSTEARHYVQYDQGEDRWLCTLILQMGYRVEYAAASDAYTHAPETFNEFYNQRRRWIPSTVANIMDLLGTSKRTRKINDSISWLYIVYQWLLMGSTIIGPGTIFLMLVGAFVAAFNIDNWTSFLYNLIPILIFVIVCFTCKAETQLTVAAIISAIYGLVMVAVFVGIMIQIAEDGWLAPTTLLFFAIAGQLIIAGLFHPQEVACVVYGIIYYVTVPSMYMLLIIFSLFNLNNVTWGTREKKVVSEQPEEEQVEVVDRNGKKKSLFGSLRGVGRNGSGEGKGSEHGSIEFSCAGLFKCILCSYGRPSDEKKQLDAITESLGQLGSRLDRIEKNVDQPQQFGRRRSAQFIGCRQSGADHLGPIVEDSTVEVELHSDETGDTDTEVSEITENTEFDREHTFLVSPYWLQDERLRKGEVDFLFNTEEGFWKELIEKYLHPIDEDKKQLEKTAEDLKNLRDEFVFKFFMVNALFVLIMFLMQLNKELLHLQWPLGVKYNVTFDETSFEVYLTKEYLQLEPLGCLFIVAFASIIFIQFLAMLFHRFDTFSHILANTALDWYCCKKATDLSAEAVLEKHAVDIVRELQRVGDSEIDPNRMGAISPKRRRTIHKLEENRQRKPTVGNFESAFRKNLNDVDGTGLPRLISTRLSSRAFKAFEEKRTTVMAERKKSQIRRSEIDNIYDDANNFPGRNGTGNQTYAKRLNKDEAGYDNMAFELDNYGNTRNGGLALPPSMSQVTFQDTTADM